MPKYIQPHVPGGRIAIIPARGGSKRLPRKNILPVGGQPMLSHPIRAALDTGLFDRVVVSTEDSEIALAAQKAGASVLERPEHLAQDTSTVVQVCMHALEHYPAGEFCCIYATAALLRPETLSKAHSLLDASPPADYVLGISGYNYSPVQALKANENGFLSYMWPEFLGKQSQFYPQLCVSNGTFVWARSEAFLREKIFYGTRLRGFPVPDDQVMDIDVSEDYEALLKIFLTRS